MRTLPLLLAAVLASDVVAADKSLFPVASTPQPLTPLMERELRGCFDFFWKE